MKPHTGIEKLWLWSADLTLLEQTQHVLPHSDRPYNYNDCSCEAKSVERSQLSKHGTHSLHVSCSTMLKSRFSRSQKALSQAEKAFVCIWFNDTARCLDARTGGNAGNLTTPCTHRGGRCCLKAGPNLHRQCSRCAHAEPVCAPEALRARLHLSRTTRVTDGDGYAMVQH